MGRPAELSALTDGFIGEGFTALGGKVYFTSYLYGSPADWAGSELWETDGTPAGTRMVTDLNPGPLGSLPGSLVPVGSSLFFTADDERHGREVWRLTPEGPPAGAAV